LMLAGDFARADEVLSESLARAAAAGDKRLELRTLIEREFFRAFTSPESSTEELVGVAEHAIPLLKELGDEFGLAKAWWLRSEADVIAGRWGARAEALRLYADSNALHEELGLNYLRAGRCLVGATIESLAGNMDAAVAELQRGYDALEQMGERGTRSTVAAFLAHGLAEQARFAEAE